MAFKATITNIQYANGQINISAHYTDDATGFVADNQFTYPPDGSVDQVKATADITAQGLIYKNNLSKLTMILGKVGTVITI